MPETIAIGYLRDLDAAGIAPVSGISSAAAGQILSALDACPRYAGHVKREGRLHTGEPISCWAMHDVILAPHFWEWALAFTPIASAYLGTTPLLYSLNAFETTPHDWPPHPGIEVFHRDQDDDRFVTLFLYLTDVRDWKDGPHLFQEGTHRGGDAGFIRIMRGPAGTAFLADTRGLHLGRRPTRGRRVLAWARWGVSDPPASYVRDRLTPLPKARLGARYPNDPTMQAMIRLVVA